ncbi:AraC family transcriptional regulator [Streptomyces albireticuli]|uniref:AraC family transcriptional regulator n=1 Tax=Streptomyces albireticuli TaxID=1940 RepID=A0A2A2D781_9ACTN|nr:AraC family transcriptional regulator [Streptomyces albireticuli]MCD9194268.1 AraC family transcriptional regulator [Streptomyces albireticuli]PAU47374.1 AraC family transcriptional regulator [Streptomyces albireticuli]
MDVLSDALAALRTGHPYAALTERQGNWRVDLDSFAGAGFHVVLEGSCELLPGDGAEPVRLGAGDAVFLPHGGAHTLRASSTPAGTASPTVLLCGAYQLDQARAHPLLADFPRVLHLPAGSGRHASVRATVALLAGELRSPGAGTDIALPALLELFLIYLVRAWYEERTARPGTGWCRSLADPAVGAALRALHAEPARAWTVAGLAARAGMSRAAFARRFTTLVGRPPLTYLTWWRLTLAASILRESDAPLATVAQRIGYTSQFAFAHAFKRAYGVPAGRYRRDAQESAGDRAAVTAAVG